MPSREEIEMEQLAARLSAQAPAIVPELIIPGKPVSRMGRLRNGIVSVGKAVGKGIVKGAKYVGNGIADGARYVGSGIVSVGKAVGSGIMKGAKYVGSGIANGAKYVGSSIVDGAKYVGSSIVDGAKYVGSGIVSVGKAAGNAIGGGVKLVGDAIGFADNDYDRDFARDKLKGLGNTIVSKAALGFGLAAKGVAATVLFGTAVAAAAVLGVAAAGVSIAAGGVVAIRGGYRWNKARNMIKAIKGLTAQGYDTPEAQYAIAQLEKRVQRSKSQVAAGALGVVGGTITLAAGAATGGIVAGAVLGVAGAALGLHALGGTIAGQTDALKEGEKGGGLRDSKYMVKLFGARKKDGAGVERNKQAEAIVNGMLGLSSESDSRAYIALAKALELNINPDHLNDPAKRKSAVTLVASALKST